MFFIKKNFMRPNLEYRLLHILPSADIRHIILRLYMIFTITLVSKKVL